MTLPERRDVVSADAVQAHFTRIVRRETAGADVFPPSQPPLLREQTKQLTVTEQRYDRMRYCDMQHLAAFGALRHVEDISYTLFSGYRWISLVQFTHVRAIEGFFGTV